MKAMFGLALFFVLAMGLFATGVNEQDIDAEYAAKTYADRSDWLYEFNQMASKVHKKGLDIVNASSEDSRLHGLLDWYVTDFDEYSYRYKVMLDLGVNHQFIDDKTRQQQLEKLREERNKVSQVLSESSGLGL